MLLAELTKNMKKSSGSHRVRRVIYLSYTGMLEPLGRSQVLTYLRQLSNEYVFTLISFEKPADLACDDAVADLRAECFRYGIDWRPQVYHHRPRLLATSWDLIVLIWQTFRYSLGRDVCLVHSRSYVPAIAAWLCGKVTLKPFIFDMRALWPDEIVASGRLTLNSWTYRCLKWVERQLLYRAARVVSLTQAGVVYLLETYPGLVQQKFEVITTCVDIDRFDVPERHAGRALLKDRIPFVVGTTGSLFSGWFYLDAFLAFFQAVKKLRPDARVSIITRDDHKQVLEAVQKADISLDDVTVSCASSTEMPAKLAEMDVGVMFFSPKIGSSPTRLGEFLAAGVPVVGNTGIGDVSTLIESYQVGIVVDDVHDSCTLKKAAYDLLKRYDQIRASGACRHAAEDYFSAADGARKYRGLYRDLILEASELGRAR